MLLNPGTVLRGRYEIVEKIGSGGMAVVYRGRDRELERYVTVKVLREEYIGDDEFIERFRSEARSAAKLSHPNIVRVYDVGADDDINFIVMEYIHGDTLKKAIKEKAPFDSRSTINVAIQVASALSQAHKGHIVHRDIKPQNILVGTDGVVKVTDFGIARAATATTMTTTANAAGSVHYFSPEQARGGYVDEKSDIYSLGITMFEMITGRLPFQGNNSVSIALKHINEELPDIRQYNPNCSPSLEGIIHKATMKKADERYASIEQLLADLIRARAELTGVAIPPLMEDGPQKKQAQWTEVPEDSVMMRRGSSTAQRMSNTGRRNANRASGTDGNGGAGTAAASAEVMADANGTANSASGINNVSGTSSASGTGSASGADVTSGTGDAAGTGGASSPNGAGIRMSKRAEAAAQLRAAQAAKGKAEDGRAQAVRLVEAVEQTKPADQKELEYIRTHKWQEQAEEPRELDVPLVSFEKYGKKLRLAKEDEYEREYMEAEPLRASKRPEKVRKNPRLEEDYDSESDRRAEKKVIIAAVITALVLIGVISLVGMRALSGGWGFGGFAASDEEVEMPSLLGKTLSAATKEAEALGIELVEEGQEQSKYYDTGEICYQSAVEGTKVPVNGKIGIKISTGLTSEKMPDMKELTEEEATEKIVNLVGTNPSIEYEYDEEIEVKKVIGQSPAEGETINAKSRIVLTISKGKEGGDVAVPNVVNATEEKARQDLEAVGLVVGTVSHTESTTVEKGRVITQTISANQQVPSGSVVNLVVSSGPPQTNEPEPPQQNPQTPEPTTQTVPDNSGSMTEGTKYFTINAPAGGGSHYVRVVKNDADGAFPVVDEYRDTEDFPYSVAVTGRGSGTVTCYVDSVEQWTQSVNFSE